MRIIFIVCLGAFLLNFSCDDNCNTSEPVMEVLFNDTTTMYSSFYGIGGSDALLNSYRNTYYIPLAINTDTSIYVFENNEIADTLAISYQRNFVYVGKNCGYRVECDSFKLIKSSGFDSVNFVIEKNTHVYTYSLPYKVLKVIVY